MIRVVLLGLGNVGVHLAKAFIDSNQIELLQIYNRTEKNTKLFHESIPITSELKDLKVADVYIITISDDALSIFSEQLHFQQGLVVHTSGSASLDALKCKTNKGVFYPVQSFSKDREVDFHNIPMAIEAERESDFKLLEKLAKSISNQVYSLNSEQRQYLHVAAVFANNFTNHMCKIAYDICEDHEMSFDLLKPIILETATKVQSVIPIKAQTGPAMRNDKNIIENHLLLLNKNQKEIYTLVTNSIIDSTK